jgi:trehalose 6-phosphate phosphatase
MMKEPENTAIVMHYIDNAIARIAQLEAAADRSAALLLDYDGTLTPIVDRPDQAFLGQEMRGLLRRLAAIHPLAIVSGRDVGDVRRLVDIDDIIYVGSHGLDIETTAGSYQPGEPFRADILRAAERLQHALAGLENAFVQPKRYAITVHTRLVTPENKVLVAEVVQHVLADEPRLRYMAGKEMHELRPDLDWHKGAAINWLLERELAGHPPIFIGDDVTDEDGFRAVTGSGLGVRVGEADVRTAATHLLPDVTAVGFLLERLLDRARTCHRG